MLTVQQSEKNGKPYAQIDRIGSESRPNLSISWLQLHAMLTDYSRLDVALFTEREAAAKWLSVPVEY
jgi:hypothetical protein